MNKPVNPADLDDLAAPLYAPGKTVYPQSVSGTFRNIKWGLMAVTLAVYYILPFVRWDRGPNAPSQAVLIDFPTRRFYFFFIELWPQEIYYFTGLLIIAAMTLFLMNAVGGASGAAICVRRRCGPTCFTPWSALSKATGASASGRPARRSPSSAFARSPPSTRSGCSSPGGPAAPGCCISPMPRPWSSNWRPVQRPPRPICGSLFLPSRPMCLPAICASRSVSTCARGRAFRRP